MPVSEALEAEQLSQAETDEAETVVTQAAWDETVTTGYKCSSCGATK